VQKPNEGQSLTSLHCPLTKSCDLRRAVAVAIAIAVVAITVAVAILAASAIAMTTPPLSLLLWSLPLL
jgi:hypothetical protein